jgi:hypothetical protein
MLCGLPCVTNLGVKKMLERMEAVFEGARVDNRGSQGNRSQTP